MALDDLLDDQANPDGHGYESASSADLLACGYAETISPDDRTAWMRVGSSGTITIDVNGQTVFHADHSAGRPYAQDTDIVAIALRKGRNRILVRSRQGIGLRSFSVQVSQPRDDAPRRSQAAHPRGRICGRSHSHMTATLGAANICSSIPAGSGRRGVTRPAAGARPVWGRICRAWCPHKIGPRSCGRCSSRRAESRTAIGRSSSP